VLQFHLKGVYSIPILPMSLPYNGLLPVPACGY
jgi:hypothetical protein